MRASSSPLPALVPALLLQLLLGALASSCNGCVQTGPCQSDADCDATGEGFQRCDVKAGICLCVDARGCGQNEVCNAAGRCQPLSGCTTNDDCGGSGLFCDTTTAQCLSVTECSPGDGEVCCSQDSQCPFNQVCDKLSLKCIAGCRDIGDCVLGLGCVGGGLGRLGQCSNACTDDNLCCPGEFCNLDEGECQPDTRGPYCTSCSGGVASDDCHAGGEFDSYCLVDTVNGGEFCGVDCTEGQACPNGYRCDEVIIVPPQAPLCQSEGCVIGAGGGHCSINTAAPCTVDEDCPAGPPFGNCPELTGVTGNCEVDENVVCDSDMDCPSGACLLKECRGGEGDNIGACACTKDADCPRDRCVDNEGGARGHCELSGHPCFQDLDCDVITCKDGGCLIGKNCAPANNRTCADLGNDPCFDARP